jgi:Tfp pilus assembly protein PilF
MLKKAISLEPSPDSPDTALVWLALAYDARGQKQLALREIDEARSSNPNRLFVQNYTSTYIREAGRTHE